MFSPTPLHIGLCCRGGKKSAVKYLATFFSFYRWYRSCLDLITFLGSFMWCYWHLLKIASRPWLLLRLDCLMKPRTSDLKDLFGWVSSSGLTITLRTISSSTSPRRKRNKDECFLFWLWRCTSKVAWPSGLRRWFKAPVSSEAWVRIPPLPN